MKKKNEGIREKKIKNEKGKKVEWRGNARLK